MPTIRDILQDAQAPTGGGTVRDVLAQALPPAGMPAVRATGAPEAPPAPPGLGRRLLATGVRVVPPLAAGIVTANPLVAAGVGAGSEALAEAILGEGMSPGQIALQGGLSLIPGLKIGEEVGPLARTAIRAGEGSLLGAGAGAASRLVGGERTTVRDVLRDVTLGTAFGAGGGALEARGVRTLAASRAAGVAPKSAADTAARARLYEPKADEPAFFTRVPQGAEPIPAGAMPEDRILHEKMAMVFGQDQADTMVGIAQKHRDAVETQTRGVQHVEETDRLASELQVGLGQKVQAGTAFNAGELRAVSSTLRTLLEREKALAAAHAKAPTDATAAELSQLNKEVGLLTVNFMGGRAEAGRSLQILRYEAALRSDPRMQATERLLGLGVSPDQVAGILEKTPNDPVELFHAVRAMNRPRPKDLVQWYWAANILSGAPTYEHKGLAELMTTLTTPFSTPFAAAAQLLRRPAQREVTLGEIPHQLIGLHAGIIPGFKKALYLLQHGYSMDAIAQLEVGRPEVTLRDIGQVMTRGKLDLGEGAENPLITGVLNYPFRMLGALREFFRTINFEMERHAGAYQMARREAKAGEDLPTAMQRILHENPTALVERAARIGERQVYHDQAGFLTRFLLEVKQKDRSGFTSVILPFVATPASIGRRGATFTPYGFLKAARETDPRLRAQIQGEALFGTLMLIPFVKLALSGDLVGALPSDPGTRDRMMAEGVLPDTVRIGDHRVQIHQLGPLAFPASAVANAVQSVREMQLKGAAGKEVDAGTAIFDFVRRTGASWLNQSFMQGLFGFVNALEDPERWGRRWWTSTVQSAVPASGLLKSITGTIDPVIREPRTTAEAVRSVIPGLSTSVPPRIRGTGEPVTREIPFVVPPITRQTTDPVRDAMAAVGVEVEPPRRPTFRVPGQEKAHTFPRDDELAIRQAQGYAVRARAEQLLQRPAFQQLPDALKRNALRKLVAAAHGNVASIARYLQVKGRPITVESLMQAGEIPQPTAVAGR